MKKKKKKSDLDLVSISSPFDSIPKDQMDEISKKISLEFENQFNDKIEEIVQIIKKYYMLIPLSIFSAYGLTRKITDKGLSPKKTSSKIQQPFIEMLQAISLMYPLGSELKDIDLIDSKLLDYSENIFTAFSLKRLKDLRQNKNNETMFLIEKIRSHTKTVRNWGYFSHVKDILTRLIEPIDIKLKDKLEFSLLNAVNLFSYIVTNVEKLLSEHINKVGQFLNKKKLNDLIDTYYRIFKIKSEKKKFEDFVRDNNYSVKDTKIILFKHSNIFLEKIFLFNFQDFLNNLKIEENELNKVLSFFSIKFGDLSECNIEHFFLNNPIWFKPIIKKNENEYLCFLPLLFFHHSLRTLNNIANSDNNLSKIISERKSKFLELEIETLLKTHFKNSIVYTNVKWKYENKIYETDIIFKYYNVLMIIEAKSGSVSEIALRGGEKRIERHINELFIEPNIQINRLIKNIEANKKNGYIEFINYENLYIEDCNIIIKLSITLEDFATIQTISKKLKCFKVMKNNNLSTIMNLADFRVTLEIFNSESEKIHYFLWRNELIASNFIADELDLIGVYFRNEFNSYSITHSNHEMIFTGLSHPIDIYFESLDHNLSVNKPKRKYSKYWIELLNKIREKRFEGWLEISLILRGFLFKEQLSIEKGLKKIPKYLRKNKRNKKRKEALIYKNYKDQFVIFLFIFEKDYLDRYKKAESYANMIFNDHNITECFVIGFNIDKNFRPYSFIIKYGKYDKIINY